MSPACILEALLADHLSPNTPDAMLTLDFQRTASQCAILSDVLGLLLKAHTILSPYFLRMSSVCVW